jgi:opacity protein-like surface antigen
MQMNSVRYKATLLFWGLLAIAALPVQAASFEITPFVGTRVGGDFDDFETPLISEIEIDDGASAGFVFGVGFGEHWQVEFLGSRQSTDLIAKGMISGKVGIDVDNYHVGGAYQFRDSLEALRPFVALSLGSTNFEPDGDLDGEDKFSFSFGGGVKYHFNDHLGVRLQGRFTATEINDSDEVWCDPFFCYVVEDTNFLNQTELSAGLIIRIGS